MPLIVFSIKANWMILLELKSIFFPNTVCFSKVIPFTEENSRKEYRDGNRQQAMKERGESVFAVG